MSIQFQHSGWFYRIYILGDDTTNPYRKWCNMGKPFPDLNLEQVNELRKASIIHQSGIQKLHKPEISLDINGGPKISLIQLCNEFTKR